MKSNGKLNISKVIYGPKNLNFVVLASLNQTKCCSIDYYCHYSATKYSENLACETEYYFGRNLKILKESYKFEVYLNFYVYIKKLNGLKFVIKHILFIYAVIKNHTTF